MDGTVMRGLGRAAARPGPSSRYQNVTALPSRSSVYSEPITVLLCNSPLLCGFNVSIKGLTVLRSVVTWCINYTLRPNNAMLSRCCRSIAFVVCLRSCKYKRFATYSRVIIRPSTRRPYYALHPFVFLSVRPSVCPMPTVASALAKKTAQHVHLVGPIKRRQLIFLITTSERIYKIKQFLAGINYIEQQVTRCQFSANRLSI